MTGPEINEILDCVELTHPVELADIAAIREALAGADVEVFHRVREVVVRRTVGEVVYERVLPVKGAPPLAIHPKYP